MDILAITIPIFMFIGVGYVLKQKGVIGPATRNFLSWLVYYFAFPLMVFRSIVSFDFASTFRLNLVVQNLSVTFTIFALTFFTAYLIREPRKRGAFHMGCFRTNQGYMGLPVINGFYGEQAMSRAAIVNGFDSPAVIILSVFALEIFKGGARKKAVKSAGSRGGALAGVTAGMAAGRSDGANEETSAAVLKSPAYILVERMRAFVLNPFILSSVLGLALSYFRVPVLKVGILDQFLSTAGGMALPLALLSIGCSLELSKLKKNLKIVFFTTLVKLLAMPAVSFLLAWFVFGFRGVDLGMSVVISSMPSSVSSYVMALEMGADEELSAAVIGVTTLVSVVTISLIQYFMKSNFVH